MRPAEIENWALNVVHQVENGQPNEDSRVELKADWVDHYKVARQMAGHANAARGDSILWLVGVDQESGVVGADYNELANWLSQVSSCFEGTSPEVVDVNIAYQGKTIVALFIETDRAPFVVRNPHFGHERGVVIAQEVPWREGTRTRTATRSDLIRLLVPRLALPEVEVIDSELVLRKKDKHCWFLRMQLYVIPCGGASVVIPFHRCEVHVQLRPRGTTMEFDSIFMGPPRSTSTVGGSRSDPLAVGLIGDQLLLEGPSRIDLQAERWSDVETTPMEGSSAHVVARLAPAGTDRRLTLARTLRWTAAEGEGVLAQWKLD
jgi:hypothetical protein